MTNTQQLITDARKMAQQYNEATRNGNTRLATLAYRSYERIVARLGYDPLV